MGSTLKTILLAVVLSLVVPVTGKAEDIINQVYISVGASNKGTTLEVGTTYTNPQELDRLFAFGGAYLNNGSCFALKYGIEPVEDSGLFITGIAGLGLKNSKGLYPATDGRILEREDTESSFLYGVGISYFTPKSPIVISVDYDNVRKVTGGIGLVWKF